MIITQRKLKKFRRDPKQFILDTRAYLFLKEKSSNFTNIDSLFSRSYDLLKDNTPQQVVDIANLCLDRMEERHSIKKIEDKKIIKFENEGKPSTLQKAYENFNLNIFKKSFISVGYDASYSEVMTLWEDNPWSIKLIKALVFLMEQEERYLDIVCMLEKSIENYNNSRDIQLMLIQYLRKAGIYDIAKTISVADYLLKKNPQDVDVRYFLCQFLWESQGLSYMLMDHLKILQSQEDRLSVNQKAFIYACLCESGKYDEALRGYLSVRDKLIKKYFILEMLYELKNLESSKRAGCYNKINSYQTEFENMIRNAKSIAVVGNAPTEIGLNKGSAIDSADIVIRFNNYAIGGEYLADYGSKTDIWVKGGGYIDIKRRDMSQFKGVIQSGNNPLYRNSSFDDFYLESQVSQVNYTYIPPTVYYELIGKLNTSPSAGLAMLYWVYLIRGQLDRNWVFGFSFGEQKNNTSVHYFSSNNKRNFYPHNWQKEAGILRSIIKFN